MKSFLKNKKVLISLASILLVILIIGGIFIFKPNKDNVQESNTNTQETTNNYIAYIKINPSIKLEYSQTCKSNNCDKPIVNKYELLNDDAKEIFKDIDLLSDNKLDSVFNLIINKIEEKNIEVKDITIYSDWKELESYIKLNKYNYSFNHIDKKEFKNIEDTLKEKEKLTIKFDTDGGSNVESLEIEKGSKIKKPTTPEKEGYTFVEWQLNDKTFDFNHDIEENITLKAKWKKIETNINQNSNSNNNTNNASNNTNNTTTNNTDNNTSTNNNQNNQDNNNQQEIQKPKEYLSFGMFYSLEEVRRLENKYNITIKLIEGSKCGYMEGGNDQLIEEGKTYIVHISSLEPYIEGGCGE